LPGIVVEAVSTTVFFGSGVGASSAVLGTLAGTVRVTEAASYTNPNNINHLVQIRVLGIPSSNLAHALDDGQIDRWPSFFTETCVYHVTTREGHEAGLPIGIMRCVGRGMMLDRVKAFHTANIFEPHSYNHALGRASMALGPAPDTFAVSIQFSCVQDHAGRSHRPVRDRTIYGHHRP
jgi:hypothetical protein